MVRHPAVNRGSVGSTPSSPANWYGTRYEMWDGVFRLEWAVDADTDEFICMLNLDFTGFWVGYDSTLVGKKLEVPPKLKWL